MSSISDDSGLDQTRAERRRRKREALKDRGRRPEALELKVDAIPDQLRREPRWCIWRWDWDLKRGAWGKVPYQRNGKRAKSNDPATWTTFEEAARAFTSGRCDGLGFMLGDGFVGIDLDNCRDPETGEIDLWAQTIIEKVDSYSEVSPSGTGVKVFACGAFSAPGRRKGDVEIYGANRYFTVTGQHVAGTPSEVHERSTEIEAIWREALGENRQDDSGRTAHTGGSRGDGNAGPSASSTSSATPSLSDDQILDLCRRAKNAAKFERLFSGNWQSDYTSQSEADLALCCVLVFYTRDPIQVERIFSRSLLAGEKWRSREDYRRRTIEAALSVVTKTYSPRGHFENLTLDELLDLVRELCEFPKPGPDGDGLRCSQSAYGEDALVRLDYGSGSVTFSFEILASTRMPPKFRSVLARLTYRPPPELGPDQWTELAGAIMVLLDKTPPDAGYERIRAHLEEYVASKGIGVPAPPKGTQESLGPFVDAAGNTWVNVDDVVAWFQRKGVAPPPRPTQVQTVLRQIGGADIRRETVNINVSGKRTKRNFWVVPNFELEDVPEEPEEPMEPEDPEKEADPEP